MGTIVLWAAIRICNGKFNELKTVINNLSDELDEYTEGEMGVLCAAVDILPGTLITEEMLTFGCANESAVPDDIFFEPEEAVGSYARIAISQNCYLTEAMCARSLPTDDERELEYGCITLGPELYEGCLIDVRICYPDGTDYVIMSKKRVYRLDESVGALRLHVNEEELLLMDSAIVDAYNYYESGKGCSIYGTVYIEGELQESAAVNYTPSEEIIDLINSDPNIVAAASGYLSKKNRKLKEEKLYDGEENY